MKQIIQDIIFITIFVSGLALSSFYLGILYESEGATVAHNALYDVNLRINETYVKDVYNCQNFSQALLDNLTSINVSAAVVWGYDINKSKWHAFNCVMIEPQTGMLMNTNDFSNISIKKTNAINITI